MQDISTSSTTKVIQSKKKGVITELIHTSHSNFSSPEQAQEFSTESKIHPTAQQNTTVETTVKTFVSRVKS